MPRLLLLNNVVLFLCCSIYLGVGVFLIFFLLPLESQLSVDNYFLVFVEPVAHATSVLTYVTIVMLVTALIMLASEWFTGLKWPPIIVLLALITATLITHQFHFPLNEELAAGVTDSGRLAVILEEWAFYSRLRGSAWFIEWLAVMYYFYALARKARDDR